MSPHVGQLQQARYQAARSRNQYQGQARNATPEFHRDHDDDIWYAHADGSRKDPPPGRRNWILCETSLRISDHCPKAKAKHKIGFMGNCDVDDRRDEMCYDKCGDDSN